MIKSVEYNKSASGISTKCGNCGIKVIGGEFIYIPKIFKEETITFGKPICEKCYKEATK
jgi:hypothetical protein